MNLEHANVTVLDVEEATQFLSTAFPSIQIRGEGKTATGRLWRHVGTPDSYIALQEAEDDAKVRKNDYLSVGVNHIGLIVNDIESLVKRMNEAGYSQSDAGVHDEGRTSEYFFNTSGVEWEFVQYHSDDQHIRNVY